MRKTILKLTAVITAASMMSMTAFAVEDVASLEEASGSEQISLPVSENSGAQAAASEDESTLSNEGAPASSENSGAQAAASEDESTPSNEGAPASSETPSTAQNDNTKPADEEEEKQPDTSSEINNPSENENTPSDNSSTDNKESEKNADEVAANEASKSESTTESKKESEDISSSTDKKEITDGEKGLSIDGNAESLLENTEPDALEESAVRRTATYLETSAVAAESAEDNTDNNEQAQTTEDVNWSNGEIKPVMGVKATSDGQNVTISYKTQHKTPWDDNYQNNPIIVTFPDGTTKTIQFEWNGGSAVHDANGYGVIGQVIGRNSDQNDTEILEFTIPASWFGTDQFTVTGGDYTASVNAPAVTDNNNMGENAVYEGITVDGSFNDWEAVSKTTGFEQPNGQTNIESVAMRTESDYVYIYLKDSGNNAATWAGVGNNGKFALTTDLGRTTIIQFTQDGAIVGVKDYSFKHDGTQWEIAIPVSSLPDNNGGINFGYYLGDTLVTGQFEVEEIRTPSGITFDGSAEDWSYYPSTVIEYNTGGTGEIDADAQAAMYMDNMIYGHCETTIPQHVQARGDAFSGGIHVNIDKERWNGKDLEMRLVQVDDNGNINWNPSIRDLENGRHKYYIFATNAWGSSQNINDLNPNDVCYGEAYITISDTKNAMEWYIKPAEFAARYDIQADEIHTLYSNYMRIGDEWVETSGASTGPIGSVALAAVFAGIPMLKKNRFVLSLFSKA